MGCGRCGALLEDGDLFCGDCGAPVGGCPSCGKPLSPGKRFCRYCGATLVETAPAAAAWALAQIVRQRLGIAEEDPPEAAAVKLSAGLDR